MRFFHLFFPSWRFFENAGAVPALYFRSGPSADGMAEWRPLCSLYEDAGKRSFLQIFYNPVGNLIHTLNSQAAQILLQLEKNSAAEELPSFIVLKNFFDCKVAKKHFFQFKICGRTWSDHQHQHEEVQDILLSPTYQKTLA
jgi:hypothetical protein